MISRGPAGSSKGKASEGEKPKGVAQPDNFILMLQGREYWLRRRRGGKVMGKSAHKKTVRQVEETMSGGG